MNMYSTSILIRKIAKEKKSDNLTQELRKIHIKLNYSNPTLAFTLDPALTWPCSCPNPFPCLPHFGFGSVG